MTKRKLLGLIFKELDVIKFGFGEKLNMVKKELPPPSGSRFLGGAIGGAILGAAVGGPSGAVVGGIIGALLGAAAEEEERRGRW